jgi:hypothetical protein
MHNEKIVLIPHHVSSYKLTNRLHYVSTGVYNTLTGEIILVCMTVVKPPFLNKYKLNLGAFKNLMFKFSEE